MSADDSIDHGLFAYLAGSLSCSPRVYPFGKRPEDGELPAVTYQIISGPTSHYAHGGPSDHVVSYQVDSWGSEPDDAADLAEEVRVLLDGYRGEWEGGWRIGSTFLSLVLDDYEPGTKLYRRMRQVEVHYSGPTGS